MEDLKIRVANKAESKEAQELFFRLGSQWKDSGKVILEYDPSMPFFYLDGEILHKGSSVENYQVCDRREITLQELRDMVVFKRESINDKIATAEAARQELKGIDATLAERQSQYGSFEDVAFVTENIMATLAKARSNGLQDLPHTHRMALYMIASKMARIVNGDFNHLDGWHDIGGYSKLIEDLIGDNGEI